MFTLQHIIEDPLNLIWTSQCYSKDHQNKEAS